MTTTTERIVPPETEVFDWTITTESLAKYGYRAVWVNDSDSGKVAKMIVEQDDNAFWTLYLFTDTESAEPANTFGIGDTQLNRSIADALVKVAKMGAYHAGKCDYENHVVSLPFTSAFESSNVAPSEQVAVSMLQRDILKSEDDDTRSFGNQSKVMHIDVDNITAARA